MRHGMTGMHAEYMALALQLAEKGRLSVSPNPLVGCVIVRDGQLVGQGYHQKAGEKHAEILALEDAGPAARGATLYVTLEPCAHTGRTPPCTDALIAAGISTVCVASMDPNPLVAGRGIALLRAAGMTVLVGEGEAAARQLNEFFFHYITCRRPFVLAKWAMSLDGKTVTQPADSRQISSASMNACTHDLRARVDAILVGAQTVRSDNPALTARCGANQADLQPRQPLRIVLAGTQPLSPQATIFNPALPGKTLLVAGNAEVCRNLPATVEQWILPGRNGLVALPELLEALGRREITSLLVEGGMTVHHAFLRENLVNRVQASVSPVIVGDLANKKVLDGLSCEQRGRDFCFSIKIN